MHTVRKILLRLLRYAVIFLIILVSLNVVLGATGFSDSLAESQVNQELRGIRQAMAETIRDPAELESAMEAQRKELEELHGLNKHWVERLPQTTLNVLKLDFGNAKTLRSFSGSSKISVITLERLPNTMLIMLSYLGITFAIGGYLGIHAAVNRGGKIDRFVSIAGPVVNAVPSWLIGLIAIMLFSATWNLLPAGGMYSTPPPTDSLARFMDVLKHAILPVGSLAFVGIGRYMYTIRSITLKVTQDDFVTFARARGLSEKRVWWRYIVRPAAPPIATGIVMSLAASFSGAIITETVFNWPGMGRMYIDALLGTPDEGIIVALTVVFTLIYLAARFFLDILYVVLDPRVRY